MAKHWDSFLSYCISKPWTNIIEKIVHKCPTQYTHYACTNCKPSWTWQPHKLLPRSNCMDHSLTKYIVTVGLKPCLDCWKSLLDGVQIGGVGGEVQQSHSTFQKNQYYLGRINQYILFFNHLTDTWNFMDAHIVHDKHQVWQRPGLHSVQYTTNKILELFAPKGVI